MNKNLVNEIIFDSEYLKKMYDRMTDFRESIKELCIEFIKTEIMTHEDWTRLMLVQIANKEEFLSHINEFLEDCEYDICSDSVMNVIYFAGEDVSYDNMCVVFSYNMNESFEENVKAAEKLADSDEEYDGEKSDEELLSEYMKNFYKNSKSKLPS